MIFKLVKSNKHVEDEEFDLIYPQYIRPKADTHFTPIQVCKVAARLLTRKPNAKILDIGSGVGKFCSVGAVCTDGYFYGVEQREGLCNIANEVCDKYGLTNVEIIHANVMDLSFSDYDAFYFFNSFQENLSLEEKIDDEVALTRELYVQYTNYVRSQLATRPVGTTVVTYYSFMREIPDSYMCVLSLFDDKLKYWEKIH
jgi:Methyltransferase domain